MRAIDPTTEMEWMTTILADDEIAVEFYETKAEALSAAETAKGRGVSVFVSRITEQS